MTNEVRFKAWTNEQTRTDRWTQWKGYLSSKLNEILSLGCEEPSPRLETVPTTYFALVEDYH